MSNEFAHRYGDQGIVSISLNPGIIKTELLRHMNLFEYFMIVNTYHILHTLISSLTDYVLVYRRIFNFIWRLDAIVGCYITSRSRVERQGKIFYNSKRK